jgi:hypothetical protein
MARTAEQDVLSAAPGPLSCGFRNRSIPAKIGPRLLTATVLVNVNNQQSGCCTGGNPNIRVGAIGPPLSDLLRIGGGVLESVLRKRFLAAGLARKNRKTLLGVPKRPL